MDQFLDWLDANIALTLLKHVWPWALVTAALAIASLAGIIAVARRYSEGTDSTQFSIEH
jgi:hypothetical protein